LPVVAHHLGDPVEQVFIGHRRAAISAIIFRIVAAS
jgi:hypothetical protein